MFVMVLILSCSFIQPYAQDYCDEEYECDGIKNTMCLYPSSTEKRSVGNCTKQEDYGQKNYDLSKYWLALVNTFRDQLAGGLIPNMPPASKMKQLVWHPTLARHARRWAFQCQLSVKEDPCNKFDLESKPLIAQNYERNLESKIEYDDTNIFLKQFLKQIEPYKTFSTKFETWKFGDLSEEEKRYITYVLPNSRLIGAAFVSFVIKGNKSYNMIFNTYVAPRKIKKGPLYETGDKCDCPHGYWCKEESTYKNLCAKNSDPTNGEYVKGLPGSARALCVGVCTNLPVLYFLVFIYS